MRYLPFRPLIDWRPLAWDDDNWPDLQSNSGLNVYIDEKETEVTVEAPVPGMDPKNLKVTYHDGMLHIYGSASEKDEERKKGKVIKKWEMASSVDYVTALPRPIDTKSIDAKIKDGVITIKAKIAEEAKPKEIEVKIG
jgi:HSP20 family protein